MGRRWLDILALSLATLFVSLCGLIAAAGVTDFEKDVFHAINGLPDALFRPMWTMQFLGVLLVPAAVAVIAIVARKWHLAAALLLLIPLKLFFEKGVVKEMVYRARPGTSDCAGDPSCLQLRDVPMVGPSFPSGHVIIVFGIAWLVFPYLGTRWRWVVGILCLLVSFARIYLGAHNPLDVLAGAAIGIGIASALNLIVGVPIKRQG